WFAFSPPTNPEIAALHDAFLQELRAQGFVEGQNVRIERRYIEGREERATALAAELVGMKVDLIFATYSGAVRAATDATSTIPIVKGSSRVSRGQVGMSRGPQASVLNLAQSFCRSPRKPFLNDRVSRSSGTRTSRYRR